jgi:MFS superfamily sulfate permease-like transporter
MKYAAIMLLSLLTGIGHAEVKSFSALLTDPVWNGKEIPANQQCEKFGGKGTTPRLSIQQIPAGANAIVMEYSDRTYQPMDLGGHGKFGYRIEANLSFVNIPSVTGHTFDLPQGFFLIQAQRAPTWDRAGAYLPPCSGGKGNDYYVTVKAVKEINGGIREVLGETEVRLGKY